MMKNTYKGLWTVVIIVSSFLTIGVIYLLLSLYYRDAFAVNTWINGIYCTGKTIEEVNSELLSMAKAPNVAIKDINGMVCELKAEDIDLLPDYSAFLQSYAEEQNVWMWFDNFKDEKNTTVYPQSIYDEALLREYWNTLPFVKKEMETQKTVEIILTDNGYALNNGLQARLDTEKGFELLKSAISEAFLDSAGTTIEIDLNNAGLYADIDPNEDQKHIIDQWKKVQEFQDLQITYDMGDEKIHFDSALLADFLICKSDGSFAEDENGQLQVSYEKVVDFIIQLADTYDTYGKERSFFTTKGEWITVPAGTYGTLIDREAEITYLYGILTDKVSENHVPKYKKKPYHRGLNDIGDTYIEIDMTDQKMYLYLEGECLVDTDIVTGNTSRNWDTPEGVNYIYAMQRNRILRGADYASFVNYWMPVTGNIGIHDAGWRKNFGGNIYKKSGSHGCINTPYKHMKTIYENVEIGVPVIMFY